MPRFMNHTPEKPRSGRLVLAPMQGLCDFVMRDLLTRIGGYDECVSEFVRITHTVHSRATWLRHVPEIATTNKTHAGIPCVVQMLGSDAEMMLKNALVAVGLGAHQIDLNFGCPAPTVNKHQGGAVLLQTPERIYHIVSVMRQGVPEHIPISAKMRLGFENKDLALENADAIAQAGASVLTVHARTKIEGYRPPAHWGWVDKIRRHVAIPVIANGDVFRLQDYIDIRTQSGCDDVMLGRGAVMRPDLARQIRQYLHGEEVQAALFDDEIIVWIAQFIELCLQHEPQGKYAVARLKQWLGMMRDVYPEAESLFQAIRTLREIEPIRAHIRTLITRS